MSLRITSYRASRSAQAQAARPRGTFDSYLERLVKLVPAEAVAAYPFLRTQAPDYGWAEPLLAVVLLLVVIALRWRATATPSAGPQIPSIIISAISFIIYAFVVGDPLSLQSSQSIGVDLPKDAVTYIAQILLVAWVLVVPMLYTGDD